MKRYILMRLAAAIPVVLGATVVVFLILHLTPGDPVRLILGHARASPERIEELREQLGLDRPAWAVRQACGLAPGQMR